MENLRNILSKISKKDLENNDISFIESNKIKIFDFLFESKTINLETFSFFYKDIDFRSRLKEERFVPDIDIIRFLIAVEDEEVLIFLCDITNLNIEGNDLLEIINRNLKKVAKKIILNNKKFKKAIFIQALLESGFIDDDILKEALNHLENKSLLKLIISISQKKNLSIDKQLIEYLIRIDYEKLSSLANNKTVSFDILKKMKVIPTVLFIEYREEMENEESLPNNLKIINAPTHSKYRTESILNNPTIATNKELLKLSKNPQCEKELLKRECEETISYLNKSNRKLSDLLSINSSSSFISNILPKTNFKYSQELWEKFDLKKIEDLELKLLINMSFSNKKEVSNIKKVFSIKKLVDSLNDKKLKKIRINPDKLDLTEEEIKLLATSSNFSMSSINVGNFDYSDLYKLSSTGAFLKAFKEIDDKQKIYFINSEKTNPKYLDVILKNILNITDGSNFINEIVSNIASIKMKKLNLPLHILQFLNEETIINNVIISKDILKLSKNNSPIISNVIDFIDLLHKEGHDLSNMNDYRLYNAKKVIADLGEKTKLYNIKTESSTELNDSEMLFDLSDINLIKNLKSIKCKNANSSDLIKVLGKKCYIENLNYDMMINIKLDVSIENFIISNYKVIPSTNYINDLNPKNIILNKIDKNIIDLIINLKNLNISINSTAMASFKRTNDFKKLVWNKETFEFINKYGNMIPSEYQQLINIGHLDIIEFYYEKYGYTPFYCDSKKPTPFIKKLIDEFKIFKSLNVASIFYNNNIVNKTFKPIDCSKLSLDEKNEIIDRLSVFDNRILSYKKRNIASFTTIVPFDDYVDIENETNFKLLRVNDNQKEIVKNYCLIVGDKLVSKIINFYKICDHFNIESNINDLLDFKNNECEENERFHKINYEFLEKMPLILDTPILTKCKKKNLFKFLSTIEYSSTIPDIGDMYRQLKDRIKLAPEEVVQSLEKQLFDIMQIDSAPRCHNRLTYLETFVSKNNAFERLGLDKYYSLESEKFDNYFLYFPRNRADLVFLGTEHGWCVKNNDSYGDNVIKKGYILVAICEERSDINKAVALCNLQRNLDGSLSLEQIRWTKIGRPRENMDASKEINYQKIIELVSRD